MRKRSAFLFLLLLLVCCTVLVQAEEFGKTAVPSLALSIAGTETRLLPANYDVWSCDWAPDGSALVFAGKLQGEDAAKMRIWSCGLLPAGDPSQITNTEQLIDFSPRWSPDSKWVVMTRRTYGKTKSISALWLKEVESGSGKQLTLGPLDRDPSWSPDGTKVAFSRGQGPYQGRLAVIDISSGSVAYLAGKEDELINSPWWGSNGFIYYTKFTPSPKKVTVSGQNYEVMDFGRGSIWAVNPRDNSINPVVVDEYDNRQPALSPDGKKLAYVSNRLMTKEGNGKYDRGSLYIKNLETGDTFFVTNKVGLNGGSLSWSPDGKRLAFFTFRSIRPAVWVINIP